MQRIDNFYHIITRSGALTMLAILVAMTMLSGCNASESKESKTANAEAYEEPQFHADADIAMTVRSIADALRVDEPLDSVDYNFRGILTDGMRRPIYTDIYGNPGEWEVDVLTPVSAVVRNLNPGDLLPDDLQEYLLNNLDINPENEVQNADYIEDAETNIDIYDFEGGVVRFETRTFQSPNGTDATFMSIILTKDA